MFLIPSNFLVALGASLLNSCNITRQRFALEELFVQTGGKSWINRTGWTPSWTGYSTTGSCATTLGPPLPDHCCWFGIQCCAASTCPFNSNNSTSGNIVCDCDQDGLVVSLSLGMNNLSGQAFRTSAGTVEFMSNWTIQAALGCSLVNLDLHQNLLTGPLPADLLALTALQALSLADNEMTGMLPSSVAGMSALTYLDLSWNRFEGTISSQFCGGIIGGTTTDHYGNLSSGAASTASSGIVYMHLGNNQLSGSLNLTLCNKLAVFDVTNNGMSGYIPPMLSTSPLLVANMASNAFKNLMYGRHVNQMNMPFNNLTGQLPVELSALVYLSSVNLAQNNCSGTLPVSLMSLGSLSSVEMADNWITGTIPLEIGKAKSLSYLDLSNNSLTGSLPNSILDVMASYGTLLDLRLNYMSCCGSGFQHDPTYSVVSYLSYNYSAPPLPPGLTFSTHLRPITFTPTAPNITYASNLGNTTYYPGMSCPYIKRVEDPDQQYYLLNWYLDPEYTMFTGCTCALGTQLVYFMSGNLKVAQCIAPSLPPPPWWQQMPWLLVIIALAGAFTIMAVVLTCIYKRSVRPKILQDMLDMRKRIKGQPISGMVSVVVTDIEGFSNLMKSRPEHMVKALLTHNSLLQKAKWDNFGSVIEQEGDSYSIIFQEAMEAVIFCVQAQLLLQAQSWPSELFSSIEDDEMRGGRSQGSSLFAGMRRRMKKIIDSSGVPTNSAAGTSGGGGSSGGGGVASALAASAESFGFPSTRPQQGSGSEAAAMSRQASILAGLAASATSTARDIQNRLQQMSSASSRADPIMEPQSVGSPKLGGSIENNERGSALSDRSVRASAASVFLKMINRAGSHDDDSLLQIPSAVADCEAANSSLTPAITLLHERISKTSSGGLSLQRKGSDLANQVVPGSGIVIMESNTAVSQSAVSRPSTRAQRASVSALEGRKSGSSLMRAISSGKKSSSVPHSVVNGLKVRMGIATGLLPLGVTPAASTVMEQAKLVSDAGKGGQVLMCNATYRIVKDMCVDLGRVTVDGLRRENSSSTMPWSISWLWCRPPAKKSDNEAVLLDMGRYCKSPSQLPLALPPELLGMPKKAIRERWHNSAAAIHASPPPNTDHGAAATATADVEELPAIAPRPGADIKATTAARVGWASVLTSIALSPKVPATSASSIASGTLSAVANSSAQGVTGGATSGTKRSHGVSRVWDMVLPTPHSYSSNKGLQQPVAAGSSTGFLRASQKIVGALGLSRRTGRDDVGMWSEHVQALQLYQALHPSLLPRGRLFGSTLALKEEWQILSTGYFHAPGSTLYPLGSTDKVPQGLWTPPVTHVFCKVEKTGGVGGLSKRDMDDLHAELVALMYSIMRQIPDSYMMREQDGELKYIAVFASPEAALVWCMAVQECAMYIRWPASILSYWGEEEYGADGRLLFRGPRLKMGVCEGVPGSIVPDYLGRADYHGTSVNQAARFMDAAAHGGQIACKEELAECVFSAWDHRSAAAAAAASDLSNEDVPAFETPINVLGVGLPDLDTDEDAQNGSNNMASFRLELPPLYERRGNSGMLSRSPRLGLPVSPTSSFGPGPVSPTVSPFPGPAKLESLPEGLESKASCRSSLDKNELESSYVTLESRLLGDAGSKQQDSSKLNPSNDEEENGDSMNAVSSSEVVLVPKLQHSGNPAPWQIRVEGVNSALYDECGAADVVASNNQQDAEEDSGGGGRCAEGALSPSQYKPVVPMAVVPGPVVPMAIVPGPVVPMAVVPGPVVPMAVAPQGVDSPGKSLDRSSGLTNRQSVDHVDDENMTEGIQLTFRQSAVDLAVGRSSGNCDLHQSSAPIGSAAMNYFSSARPIAEAIEVSPTGAVQQILPVVDMQAGTTSKRLGSRNEEGANIVTTEEAENDQYNQHEKHVVHTKLSVGHCQGLPSSSVVDELVWSGRAVAIPIGRYRFKGSAEVISMVAVTSDLLSERRFSLDAPKGGKGGRLEGPTGEPLKTYHAPLLKVVEEYRILFGLSKW